MVKLLFVFQSTPLANERRKFPYVILCHPSREFQSTPLANERRKEMPRVLHISTTGFNPLLSRTRGESEGASSIPAVMRWFQSTPLANERRKDNQQTKSLSRESVSIHSSREREEKAKNEWNTPAVYIVSIHSSREREEKDCRSQSSASSFHGFNPLLSRTRGESYFFGLLTVDAIKFQSTPLANERRKTQGISRLTP